MKVLGKVIKKLKRFQAYSKCFKIITSFSLTLRAKTFPKKAFRISQPSRFYFIIT